MSKLDDSREGSMKKICFLFVALDCIFKTKVAATISPIVGKCCPSDRVFSATENFTCAYTDNRDRLFYTLNDDDSSVRDYFDGCRDSENLTITSLDETIDSRIRVPAGNATSACIDLLWDGKIGRAIPIILSCEKNLEHPEESPILPISQETARYSVPILTDLRICCRLNSVFHVGKRDCVSIDERHLDLSKYLKFLRGKSDFVSIVRGPPKCKHASIDYVINATKDLRVLDDGSLEVILPSKGNGSMTSISINEKNSCLDPGTFDDPSGLMVLRICTDSKYCKRNTCVRKCCPEQQAIVDGICDELPNYTPPGRFHDVLVNASITRGTNASVKFMDSLDYGLLIGKPCKYGMFPIEPDEGWYLNRRGQFYLPLYRVYDHHEYCMDMFYQSPNDTEQLYPFVCFDDSYQLYEESKLRYWIFSILELISCMFLILTLLVYMCLPTLRNLHGKTLMCHVASLIVAYAALATVGLVAPSKSTDPNEGAKIRCKYLGYTLLLSWIAAFSWLNVMCFDIWWTFGGSGGAGISGRHGKAYKKRFFTYSLYAWGFPLFVTLIGVAVDRTTVIPKYLRPNIGSDSCWFERNVYYYGEIVFFVGPVSIQLIANVIFFILTAKYCSKVKAEIDRVMATPTDPRSRRFQSDRTKLIMNVKLFIVMGVSWSLEVISSYLNHYATSLRWRNEFFYISDFFNCLQGLLIFILFVLKGKVYHALRRRLGRPERANTPAVDQGGTGLRDPYRMRNSASSSTIMSTFGVSASP